MPDDVKASKPLFGQSGGQHALAGLIDHAETYGPSVMDSFAASLRDVEMFVDLGAGSGRDIAIVKRHHPGAKAVAIDAGTEYARNLVGKADEVRVLNIEHDAFPFGDESVDLILANQVLEHTKEVFWIFHEVSRSLKVGGTFIFGVPNICSLHNRLLMLFGVQPTQHKLCSAHVRPFSRADTLKFLEECFPGGYVLGAFAGAQFYPFPPVLARLLARMFPTLAFSIFFMIRKQRSYAGEFVGYPSRAQFETNFWLGRTGNASQYEGSVS